MKFAVAFALLAAVALAVPSPNTLKRQDDGVAPPPENPDTEVPPPEETPEAPGLEGEDYEIINLARNLEALELAYWNQGLENFTEEDFFNANIEVSVVEEFRDHETAHFNPLNDLLGDGFEACAYDTFGVEDMQSYLEQAQVVTSIGEGAFIGALSVLQNGTLRQSGGSIIGNEARQNSRLRQALGQNFFNDAPFDTPLTAAQAYSLAQPFLSGCPESNPAINFQVIPPVTATFADEEQTEAGATVNLEWASMTILNKSDLIPVELEQTGEGQGTITLPDGLDGTAFIVVTDYEGPAPIPDEQNYAIGYIVVN